MTNAAKSLSMWKTVPPIAVSSVGGIKKSTLMGTGPGEVQVCHLAFPRSFTSGLNPASRNLAPNSR